MPSSTDTLLTWALMDFGQLGRAACPGTVEVKLMMQHEWGPHRQGPQAGGIRSNVDITILPIEELLYYQFIPTPMPWGALVRR